MAKKTIINLADRTFYLKGDITLSPKGSVEIVEQEAEYLLGLYPGELAIAGETLVAPAPTEGASEYSKMTVPQLKEVLTAAGVAIPEGAKKPDLVALAEASVKKSEAPQGDGSPE